MHWERLDDTPIPGAAGRLVLFRDKHDFIIRTTSGAELMSTRKHQSEDVLGERACSRLAGGTASGKQTRVLIGGLGMGFTLAAALRVLGPEAEVTVAELAPGVIEWNRGALGEAAGRPLDDARARVFPGDVRRLLGADKTPFDAIALDVDNGPEGLTQDANDWLYSNAGLAAVRASLRPAGRVGFWSAVPDPAFSRRLRRSGATVEEMRVHAHGKKGTKHHLWFASW